MTLQAELKRLAETDPLTGLSNRRHMDEALNAALSSVESGVTLVAIDLDGFKPANDRFGHAAGDAILCEVAERLRIVFPGATCIARMGGDEFAVLITPQLPGSAVDHLEESLKAMLGLPYQFCDETIAVTASVGFGHGQSSVTEAMVVTRRADEGLYADKARKTGRAPHTSAA